VSGDGGRFRVNVFRKATGVGATFRTIPSQVPTLESLGLPPVITKFCDLQQGMVLVTGSTGTGKSTTLAAMIDHINTTSNCNIISLEDPIEFVHGSKRSQIVQRELGTHIPSFAEGVRASLREDPDVILVGELRDGETISMAMTAAETGHLVLGTLHTSNAGQTIGRIINAFPAEEQSQVRATLSESLRAVVSQRLVPRADGQGRVVALEVLIANIAVSNLIREEREYQVGSVMVTGKSQGMVVLDDSLAELVSAGTIDKVQARRFAENKERFK
jgi:twitching motility protein PilT